MTIRKGVSDITYLTYYTYIEWFTHTITFVLHTCSEIFLKLNSSCLFLIIIQIESAHKKGDSVKSHTLDQELHSVSSITHYSPLSLYVLFILANWHERTLEEEN